MKAFLQIEAAELCQVQAQRGETDSLASGAALQVDWAVPKVGSWPRNPAGGTVTMPASRGERDKNEVFVRQLPWNISEEALKAAMENFRPTTHISLGTRSDGKPSGLAWVTFTSSEVAAKKGHQSEACGTQPKQGTANQALGFVFLPINNVDVYALSVSSEDSITLNLDSAASGSLGNHPAFAQTPCTPMTWSRINEGRIAGSGSEGSISGTSEVPVVYTTPPIEHTLQATHNLLSVNDVLTKNKFSVLFDHSDMTVDGLDLMLSDKTNNSEATCNCEACVLAKMYWLPHPCSLGARYWPDKLLEVVTADLMVFSHNNKSLGGSSCYLTLTVRNALDTVLGLGLTAIWVLKVKKDNTPVEVVEQEMCTYDALLDNMIATIAALMEVNEPTRDTVFQAILDRNADTAALFSQGLFYLRAHLVVPADVHADDAEDINALIALDVGNIPPPVP
ncbi:hypothetical protein CcCBS67573_g09886 [Chytriomyces confervae]|uniref:RRM domain-containing protein n=1 Tax=Chytriomyces confervae TaxID=246404 RepID=A0A507DL69_9FUNG|nr:hypothetical protein CcCBS67573_g09886 [Chytriomyces confervae]